MSSFLDGMNACVLNYSHSKRRITSRKRIDRWGPAVETEWLLGGRNSVSTHKITMIILNFKFTALSLYEVLTSYILEF
jgi:hypothetical protein